ncbi:MAG TPA: PA14 domain-containing protein, partial [Verrucomicrobiae bacterium]|nr:PA14 domain-containing protein [Verrucomicrobiae bacterium]
MPDSIADRGELLLGELNCIACHQADAATKARLAPKQAPVLGQEAITPQYLRKFLADPQSEKPGSAMPDLLHGMDAAERTAAEDSLVHFLISQMNASNSPAVAADEFKIQQGRLLYQQIGCVACHAPQESPSILQSKAPATETKSGLAGTLALPQESLERESVPLGDLARKTTVEALARFLKDPLKVRPSGRMPSMNLTDVEANAIAMYLLRAQTSVPTGNGPRPKTQGLAFQYFEGNFEQTGDLEKQKPKSSGLIERFGIGDRKNKQHFGLRLTGVLTVPTDGNYTFYTDSDDGSRLFVDGSLVVQNDGIHGATEQKGEIELKAGEHPILVTYFNGGSGASLKVSYAGPGISKREIPSSALFTYGGQPMLPLDREQFVVDAGKAVRGKELFASLGCVSCHAMKAMSATAPKAKDFASISNNGGCLAENPSKGIPKFAFSANQREAIERTLARRADLPKPLDAAGQVNHTMAALNCFACHSRAGVGGPPVGRAEYFSVLGEADLGDEGRIPPHLTRVGDKLRAEWIREVLLNKGFVRPYMATRMPQFGERNVGHLPMALAQADSGTAAGETADTPADAKFGRNLVGTGGFSCISCHTFGPHKSLGIPAMDLTQMAKRLKKNWFHRYLLDPQALRPGTR